MPVRKQPLMYHAAPQSLREQIKKKGLHIAKEGGFSSETWADPIYGKRPLFLSAFPEGSAFFEFATSKTDLWQVRTDGLPLVADLPSLIDAGWSADDWRGLVNSGMRRFDYWFSYEELLLPGSLAAAVAIADTETVAVCENISAERISLQKT